MKLHEEHQNTYLKAFNFETDQPWFTVLNAASFLSSLSNHMKKT